MMIVDLPKIEYDYLVIVMHLSERTNVMINRIRTTLLGVLGVSVLLYMAGCGMPEAVSKKPVSTVQAHAEQDSTAKKPTTIDSHDVPDQTQEQDTAQET